MSVTLHLKLLEIGPGDWLEVLDADGVVVLELTSEFSGPRWLPAVPGDTAVLRLFADDVGEGAGVEVDMVAFDKDGPPEPRAICPPSDLLDDMTCYKAGERCANLARYAAGTAVARLSVSAENLRDPLLTRSWKCTGFLIDHDGRRDLVLTAGHCVWDDENNGDMWRVRSIDVEFGAEYGVGGPGGDCECEGGAPPAACNVPNANLCDTPKTACAGPDVIAAAGWVDDPTCECDWALIQLAAPAPVAYTPLPIAAEPAHPFDLYLAQHPSGRCKEIDSGASVADPDPCKYQHFADMLIGSSGSPVIDTAGNVARGVNISQSAGPACPNFATNMSVIIPALPLAVAHLAVQPPRPSDLVECQGLAMGGPGPWRYQYEVTADANNGDGLIHSFHVGTADPVLANHVGAIATAPPGWAVDITADTPIPLHNFGATAHGVGPPQPGRTYECYWLNWWDPGPAGGRANWVFGHDHPAEPFDVEWVTDCDGDDDVWDSDFYADIAEWVRDSAEWWVGGHGVAESLVHGPAYAVEPKDIPTVSEWGLIVMTLLGLAAGTIVFRRRYPRGVRVG